MPGLFAPWPDAHDKGHIDIEVPGDTLRILLMELSKIYRKAGVYFEPINSRTGAVDYDYDVLVNERNSSTLPGVLEARLNDGDKVTVKIPLNWDG